MEQQSLIDALITICQQAGDAILDIYEQPDHQVRSKADHSPVTAADLAAHEIIRAGLTTLTPAIPQLSEEDTQISTEQRLVWSEFWCIDPLDGTKEFINRNGEFTVNIALIKQGKPVLGIIYSPVLRTFYWGGTEISAWKQLPEQSPAQIRSRPLGNELIITASRRHGVEANDNLLKPIEYRFRQVRNRGMGSSLKMCLIAEGVADFYPRLFPTSEWDTAAAQAIVEAAGGKLVNARNLEPLSYNQRESLENPFFFVCGDPQFPLEEIRLKSNHIN